MDVDTVVVGGGAAGLMCTIEAAKRGRSVVLIEHAGQVGKKILISGGGRCNFTNIHCHPSNYISENPHFCNSALSRYTPHHFIELVERYRIAYHQKTLGQLFCDGSARQIVSLLLRECEDYGVKILLNTSIKGIRRDTKFRIESTMGTLSSETLVIATGGLSIPKMGATDFGHRVAKQFGLSLVPPRPGLVPLTLGGAALSRYSPLSGVAIPTIVENNGQSFKESLLFTHKGISGPVILQISSYWKRGESIKIDLLPEVGLEEELLERKIAGERSELKTILGRLLPKKLADVLSEQLGSNRPLIQYSDKEITTLSRQLKGWELSPDGTEGYAKAEVTLGGVNTNELSSKTFESRKVPGLFFIGEVVDVTGHLGGFNFQWAWASGHAAGQYC